MKPQPLVVGVVAAVVVGTASVYDIFQLVVMVAEVCVLPPGAFRIFSSGVVVSFPLMVVVSWQLVQLGLAVLILSGGTL